MWSVFQHMVQRMWFFFYGQKETWQHGEHSFARTGAQKKQWLAAGKELFRWRSDASWIDIGMAHRFRFWHCEILDFSSFLGVHIRLLDSGLQAKHGRKSRVLAKSRGLWSFSPWHCWFFWVLIHINTIIITVLPHFKDPQGWCFFTFSLLRVGRASMLSRRPLDLGEWNKMNRIEIFLYYRSTSYSSYSSYIYIYT